MLLARTRSGRIHNFCAADDLNQGIPRNPFERHASAGRSLAGRKIGGVDLVQRVVLRLVSIEPGLAGWHRDTVGQWQAKKDLEMENVIHVAACALDRPLKGIHGARHVLFEWISDQHMIFLRIPVVGASARDVVDPIVYVMFAAGATSGVLVCFWRWRGGGWASSGSLLSKEFCTGYVSDYRGDLPKKIPSSVRSHLLSP